MNPKQLGVPAETLCDSEGRFEMVNSLLSLALGAVYVSKETMACKHEWRARRRDFQRLDSLLDREVDQIAPVGLSA